MSTPFFNEYKDFRLSDGSVMNYNIMGIPVVTSPFIPDNTMYLIDGNSKMMIGTKPKTEIELAGYRARWLVQQGLLDVLDWLGIKPIPETPIPILEALKIRVDPVL